MPSLCSALAALMAALFYLLLSGAEVATQRAFIMTAIVLIGVMADRSALTLRTLAIAAFAVLVIAPQSVVHDAQIMTRLCPSAMMFVRCRGGISHNPAEFASEADMGLAVAALIRFIERFKA